MAVDKRYQVFVSSTYQDLIEERQHLIQALLELDCIPAGMELFPAADDDQWDLIKQVIDDCDYYLVVVKGRYGTIHPDKGISYTEMEYDYALETGKPIIGFVHSEPNSLPKNLCETEAEKQQKLEAFVAKVKGKPVKFWETPGELGGVVSRSLIQLIKQHPAIGWVRANQAISASEITSRDNEISRLQTIVDELQSDIERAKDSPNFLSSYSSSARELLELWSEFSDADLHIQKASEYDDGMMKLGAHSQHFSSVLDSVAHTTAVQELVALGFIAPRGSSEEVYGLTTHGYSHIKDVIRKTFLD